jgi:hypothetical protein
MGIVGMSLVTWEDILEVATRIDASNAQLSVGDQDQEECLLLARLILDFHIRALETPKAQEPPTT